MKVEDLMLGDLVSVEGEVLRVGGLSNYDIYVDLFRDNENEVYSQIWADELDAIEPIPLTPEILEKNGWSLWEIEGEYKGLISIYGRKAPFRILDCVEINYIHELQHALRLCGINKEIEI